MPNGHDQTKPSPIGTLQPVARTPMVFNGHPVLLGANKATGQLPTPEFCRAFAQSLAETVRKAKSGSQGLRLGGDMI